MRRLLLRVYSDNENDANCTVLAVGITPKYLSLLKERWQKINRLSNKDKVALVAWYDGSTEFFEEDCSYEMFKKLWGERIAESIFNDNPTLEPASLARPEFKYVSMDTCRVFLTDQSIYWSGGPKYDSIVLESTWVDLQALFRLYDNELEPWEVEDATQGPA